MVVLARERVSAVFAGRRSRVPLAVLARERARVSGGASFRWWGHSSSCPWRALARVVPSAGGGPFRRTGVRFCCKGPVSAGTRRRNR